MMGNGRDAAGPVCTWQPVLQAAVAAHDPQRPLFLLTRVRLTPPPSSLPLFSLAFVAG